MQLESNEDLAIKAQPIDPKGYRAIDIRFMAGNFDLLRKFGLWHIFWGTDIFINGVPFLKCLMAANIVAWIIIWIITWALFK